MSAKPNVLLVCCDHLRTDWLGCGGNPVVMTPQIDQLAREGVNFTGAMSECPVCIPARRVLMTGKTPYGIHMSENIDDVPFHEGPKLAELMTRAGWQTFASGKLHTHPPRGRIGFEDVQLNEEGRREAGLAADDYDMFLMERGYAHLAYTHGLGNNEYGLRLSPLPESLTTTHWTAQKAMEFIERRDPERPFFLYVSFDKPHPPFTPPAEYYELYRDAEMPAPKQGGWMQQKQPLRMRMFTEQNNYGDWKEHPLMVTQSLRGYAAMITHIDSMIGVILGQLREHGVLDNTLIILTSDHGDQLFDHDNLAKGDFMRGSCNIPLIVRPPRSGRRGLEEIIGAVIPDMPVGLADIMPTILDFCRIPVAEELYGQSLLACLTGEERFRDYSFGFCQQNYAVSDGKLKYTWFGADGEELMFDLQNDPSDLRDLSDLPEYAAEKARLREALLGWMEENGDKVAAKMRSGETLSPREREEKIKRARQANIWNNRGRH